MKSITVRNLAIGLILGVFCLFGFSCGSDSEIKNTKPATNSKAGKTPEISEEERELQSLRTADFDYIFSLKRKDGKVFSSEDKQFLRQKTFRANRRSLTRDEKIIFIGTNYEIDKKDLKAIKERFEFQDFSKSKVDRKRPEDNTNSSGANSNENSNLTIRK